MAGGYVTVWSSQRRNDPKTCFGRRQVTSSEKSEGLTSPADVRVCESSLLKARETTHAGMLLLCVLWKRYSRDNPCLFTHCVGTIAESTEATCCREKEDGVRMLNEPACSCPKGREDCVLFVVVVMRGSRGLALFGSCSRSHGVDAHQVIACIVVVSKVYHKSDQMTAETLTSATLPCCLIIHAHIHRI